MTLRLCFNTMNFNKGDIPFGILKIDKSPKGITYIEGKIETKDILGQKPPIGIHFILANYLYRKFLSKKAELIQQYHLMNLDINASEFVRKYIHQYNYSIFSELKKNQWAIDCYVKHQTTQNGYATFPSKIDPIDILIKFEIIRNEFGQFCLEPIYYIHGEEIKSYLIERFEFILIYERTIYILKEKDWLKLNFLASPSTKELGQNDALFAEKILVDFEKLYVIERHHYFVPIEVKTAPTFAILISESVGFLIIHPIYIYDGMQLDGIYKPTSIVYRQGHKYIIHRDASKENEWLELLTNKHPDFKNQKTGHYFISIEKAKKKNWFLTFYHSILALEIEVFGIDLLQNFRYNKNLAHSEINILENSEKGMLLEFKTSFGIEVINNKELQKILLSKQRSIMLSDNTIGVLDEEWIEKYALLLKHSQIQDHKLLIPKWVLLLQRTIFDLDEQADTIISNDWWDMWTTYQNSTESLFPISSQIHATLRPYQQKGFEWMILLSKIGAGACLADDMGLGKTLQTICFLDYQMSHGFQKKALIISPSSLMYNWKQEIEKFAPHIKTAIYHSSKRNLGKSAEETFDILITSYGTARVDIDILNTIVWNTIILDESHQIKNPNALTTKAVSTLQADMKIALSGTPIMNNTIDLYSQLAFILPNLFGNKEFFVKEYSDPIDKDGDIEKTKKLKQITHPFILRRTKEQVAKDLPPKTESIIWCQMHGKQAALYNEIRMKVKSSLFLQIKDDGLSKSKMSVLAGIQKLRQVCSAPSALSEYENKTDESVKINILLDEINENLKEEKIIIFSQFLNVLEVLKSKLDALDTNYYYIDGGTPEKKRQDQINLFQQPECKVRLFLLSLKAGNAGITLTEANYVFLIDPWWNRQVEQQAIDRVYRIGQGKNVFAYRMICKDTIEEKIIALQNKKMSLSEDLIKEDEGFIKSLSEEDIMYLFD